MRRFRSIAATVRRFLHRLLSEAERRALATELDALKKSRQAELAALQGETEKYRRQMEEATRGARLCGDQYAECVALLKRGKAAVAAMEKGPSPRRRPSSFTA